MGSSVTTTSSAARAATAQQTFKLERAASAASRPCCESNAQRKATGSGSGSGSGCGSDSDEQEGGAPRAIFACVRAFSRSLAAVRKGSRVRSSKEQRHPAVAAAVAVALCPIGGAFGRKQAQRGRGVATRVTIESAADEESFTTYRPARRTHCYGWQHIPQLCSSPFPRHDLVFALSSYELTVWVRLRRDRSGARLSSCARRSGAKRKRQRASIAGRALGLIAAARGGRQLPLFRHVLPKEAGAHHTASSVVFWTITIGISPQAAQSGGRGYLLWNNCKWSDAGVTHCQWSRQPMNDD